MDLLRLSNAGLQTLATQYVASAGDVADGLPAGTSAAPGQTTSAAVAGANSVIIATAAVLATRLSATGTKVSTIGTVMTTQDRISGRQLAALRPTVGL